MTTLQQIQDAIKKAEKLNDSFSFLNHPCRNTCSGWKQGYDKGRIENKPYLLALEKAVEALEKISVDFGTDYADGNSIEAYDAMKEIAQILTKEK